MYKVTKKVDRFEVELANNGFVMTYSGYNDKDEWADDKIVMPDITQLMNEVRRLVDLPKG